jgi:hypothetical protein
VQIERRFPGIERSILLFSLAVLLYSCLQDNGAGNSSARPTSTPEPPRPQKCVGSVTEVTYDVWSGPIAMPYSEVYVISPTKVRLTRTGTSGSPPPGTRFNAGEWEFDVDPEEVALLFEQLEGVDWASIEAIPRDGPAPIGGGSARYKVTCEGGTSASLWYGEGQRYTNGRAVTAPIERFVNRALPEDMSRTVPLEPE